MSLQHSDSLRSLSTSLVIRACRRCLCCGGSWYGIHCSSLAVGPGSYSVRPSTSLRTHPERGRRPSRRVRGTAPRPPAWAAVARRHFSLAPAKERWRGAPCPLEMANVPLNRMARHPPPLHIVLSLGRGLARISNGADVWHGGRVVRHSVHADVAGGGAWRSNGLITCSSG